MVDGHRRHACLKCGSDRTHVAGRSQVPSGTFVRCDACGHVTLMSVEDVAATAPIACSKCRSHRLRSVAASTARSPVRYYRCDSCEHLTAVKNR